MQVTQTKDEGLKREFTVQVLAAEIETQVAARIAEIATTARLPGFRPGKVPLGLLRKRYGPSVMGEVLEKTVNETSAKALADNGLRPALQPKIEITSFDEGGDLEYNLSLEVMPDIKPTDFSKLQLERLVVETDEAGLLETLERLAAANKTMTPVTDDRPSADGDTLLIDFVGHIDDEPFDGGAATGYALELGSNSFIPGFEAQLAGHKAGAELAVKVSFPEEYGAEHLAGKEAMFAVKIHEIQEGAPAPIDDELAKKAGLETLEALKDAIREEQLREVREFSRMRMKRDLLDRLADDHEFEVPEAMVDQEFDAIWEQLKDAKGEEGKAKPDDERKDEYRAIARRRVRLGLLLAEVGRTNNIQTNQEDLNKATMEEARRHPGQEQMVLDHFRNNPEALQQLAAPIYEDKVVDFIVEMAKVTERTVTIEELLADPDEADKDAKAAAKAKKAPAKKKPAAGKAADNAGKAADKAGKAVDKD